MVFYTVMAQFLHDSRDDKKEQYSEHDIQENKRKSVIWLLPDIQPLHVLKKWFGANFYDCVNANNIIKLIVSIFCFKKGRLWLCKMK